MAEFFNIGRLTDLNFLFVETPSYNFRFYLPLLIFFALILLAGLLITWWLKRKYRKILPYQKLKNKISTFAIAYSIIGYLLLFFSWQQIPYLASRIWLLLMLLYFLYWWVMMVIYLKTGFQKELILLYEQSRKEKYLKGTRK